MKTIIFLCLFTILYASLDGGWQERSDLSEDDPQLAKVLKFAIDKVTPTPMIGSLRYQKLLKVYTQVVAGLNWRLLLQYGADQFTRVFDVVVYQKLDGTLQLISSSIMEAYSEEKRAGGWTVRSDLSEDSPQLAKILKFAKDKATPKPLIGSLQYKRLIKVESQIVAGTNWKLLLEYGADLFTKQIEVIVWEKLDGSLQLGSISLINDAPKTFLATRSAPDDKISLGGWVDRNDLTEDSVQVKKILDFAKSKVVPPPLIGGLRYHKLLKISTQVVAGTNWKLLIELGSEETTKKVQVIIWEKLDGSLDLTSTSTISEQETPHTQATIFGGWSEYEFDLRSNDLRSRQIAKLLDFSITQLKAQYASLVDGFVYSTVSKAYTQVVAGRNWKLIIQFQSDGFLRNVQVVIWEKLNNELSLTSASLVEDQVVDERMITGGWTKQNDISPDLLKKVVDLSMAKMDYPIKFVTFLNADNIYTQVVAGINYKMDLHFATPILIMGAPKTFTVTVQLFQGLDGSLTLTSLQAKN